MTRNVGRELVEPAYSWWPDYHRTFGPEVGEVAALAGYAPDPEQQLVLDAQFGFDRHGKRVAFEVGVICARQNMKTALFKQGALGCLFILEHRLVVWSAQEFSTAQEAFRDMCVLIESCPDLDREVAQIHRGNGDECIELKGDRRLKFKARTKGGGRGLTGDDVVLDEGYALSPAHMGALLPTLSAVRDPQVVVGSSAGHEQSAVLRGMRDRGRAGGTASLAYFEWCDDLPGECADDDCDHAITRQGCRLDDEARWLRANPAMGRRITVAHIRAERQALTPAEFARERLGWWDEPAELVEVFGPGVWGDREAPELGSQIVDVPTLGFALTLDRSRYSIVAAGHNADEKVHIEPTEPPGSSRRYSERAVVARLVHLTSTHEVDGVRPRVVVDGRGPGAAIVPALEDEGIEVVVASTADVLDGCARFYDLVVDERLVHTGDRDLDAAVADATKRPVGDRWAWGRKSGFDITALEAASLAVGALTDTAEAELVPSFAYR